MTEISYSLFLSLYAAQWLAILFLFALVLGAYNQINRVERQVRPPASRLGKGDRPPIRLGFPLPSRAFLVLLSYGCGPCVDLCEKLASLDAGDWSVITILHGEPLPADAARIPIPRPPSFAMVLRDPDRAWFRGLGGGPTPAALAFVHGRLEAQQVAPKVDWFEALIRQWPKDGEEVMRQAVVAS